MKKRPIVNYCDGYLVPTGRLIENGRFLRLIWKIMIVFCAAAWTVTAVNADDASPSNTVSSPHSPNPAILVLNSFQHGLPVPDEIDRGILTALREAGLSVSNIFIERLDLARIPGNEHRNNMATLLRHKLAGKAIGIAILEGAQAIDFAVREGKGLFPETTVFLTVTAPSIAPLAGWPQKVIDIPWRVDPAGTLKAALDLFPRTQRVVVITGTKEPVLPFIEEAKTAFAPWQNKLAFEYTNEMTYEDMIGFIASLPPHSIIIYSPYFNDRTGRAFVPAEVAVTVTKTANAPVFTTMEIYMGNGMVGGSLLKTEMIGKQAGSAAHDYLDGKLILSEPVTTIHTPKIMMFDWKALIRWEANLAGLPKDCVLLHQPVTLWSQYKLPVILSALVLLILSILTIILLILNHRMRLAEYDAKRQGTLLKTSEENYRRLIENISEEYFLYRHDPKGVFTYISPSVTQMLGYSQEEFQTHHSQYETQNLVNVEASHRTHLSIQGEQQPPYEVQVYHKNGEAVWLEVVENPIRDKDGAVVAVEGIAHNITARKRAEEEHRKLDAQSRLLEKSESLNRMAGAIAHHFNNQLSVVIGNLELIREEIRSGGNPAESLRDAFSGAHKAAEVSSLMLTYLGQNISRKTQLDLSDLCRRSLTQLRASLSETILLGSDFPVFGPTIRGSENQLQQILICLVQNAEEAMIDGRGSIFLTVRTVPGHDIPPIHRFPLDWLPRNIFYACLEVTDTGCGIEETAIDKIFDPFFTDKFAGRGLGLPVVLGILRSHEGGISVESSPKNGSVFRVFLPVTENGDSGDDQTQK